MKKMTFSLLLMLLVVMFAVCSNAITIPQQPGSISKITDQTKPLQFGVFSAQGLYSDTGRLSDMRAIPKGRGIAQIKDANKVPSNTNLRGWELFNTGNVAAQWLGDNGMARFTLPYGNYTLVIFVTDGGSGINPHYGPGIAAINIPQMPSKALGMSYKP